MFPHDQESCKDLGKVTNLYYYSLTLDATICWLCAGVLLEVLDLSWPECVCGGVCQDTPGADMVFN